MQKSLYPMERTLNLNFNNNNYRKWPWSVRTTVYRWYINAINYIITFTAIDRIYATGRIPGKEFKADVFQQKPIKLSQSVFLPIKQYPKFNFQGKILGPKGNTLKRLHEGTLCNISIRGRNSLRDNEKEEALRQSGNPAYRHLNKNLYIEISTVAPPAEAYARMSVALTEIRKYIIPDKNDEISMEQYRELMEIDPEMVKNKFGNNAQK